VCARNIIPGGDFIYQELFKAVLVFINRYKRKSFIVTIWSNVVLDENRSGRYIFRKYSIIRK
jgi:hypothetical protein